MSIPAKAPNIPPVITNASAIALAAILIGALNSLGKVKPILAPIPKVLARSGINSFNCSAKYLPIIQPNTMPNMGIKFKYTTDSSPS